MTSTQTANRNLLKRERRGALRALLGQSLLLLAAACGGGGDGTTAGGTTTSGTSTGSTATPGATGGAAGSAAKPGGTTTPSGGAATPAGGTNTAAGSAAKPGGAATTPATGSSTPAAGGAAGAAGGAPAASGSSTSGGAAGSGTSSSSSSTGTAAAGAGGSSGAKDTGTTAPSGDSPLAGEAKCLADIKDYDKAGPFMVKTEREGSVNFWVPSVPDGCKVPVIHLANGTGASCASYGEALQRFATHGFLACCYEDPNTGTGEQGLEAFKTAQTKYAKLVSKKFGSTGHSQGGQSSFVVQARAEKEFGLEGTKFAGLAMEPASGFGSQPSDIGGWQAAYKTIKSPMFMFSGQGTDGLVSEGWVMDAFNNMDKGTEAYHWSRQGATHIPVPNGEEMQIGPAWFRWKLLDDQAACKYFKSIPMMDPTWKEDASQNVQDCK